MARVRGRGRARNRIRQFLRKFIPPQLSSVLQWIANEWTAVWNFDGTNIVDTETILGTGDFALGLTNATPTATDGWWWNQYVDKFDVGRFRVELIAQTTTTFLISIQIGAVSHTFTYTFEINKKYGNISISRTGSTVNLWINGVIVDTTTNATAISQATNLLIGSTETVIGTELTRYALLLAESFEVDEETFTAPSLTGSQGTIAVATDPNGTLWSNEYSPDKSDNGNYALKEVATGNINIDPNGTLETALGLTAGTLNFYANRSELAVLPFYIALSRFTPLNDGEKFLSVMYPDAIGLTQDEIDSLLVYMRRGL